MTFAGDVPEGYTAQLMRGFIPRLVEGASQAGEMASYGISGKGDSVAILISCIGRKLVLGPRSNEEVEGVRKALDKDNCYIAGFYSYGEICPHHETGFPELHNQTMTVTTFSEK